MVHLHVVIAVNTKIRIIFHVRNFRVKIFPFVPHCAHICLPYIFYYVSGAGITYSVHVCMYASIHTVLVNIMIVVG